MNLSTQLANNWKLIGFHPGTYAIQDICRQDYVCDNWYPVQVPGDVHTTLISQGIIPDPAYVYNDTRCGWVEKRIWIYRTIFDIPQDFLLKEHQEILFEGLDTYVTVYLNGKKIGDYQNMLTEHTSNISGLLKEYGNVLVVEFHILQQMADRKLPEGFWINYSTERAYARKAGYSFGWDWTPRIATIGIWRPVSIRTWSGTRLEGVQVETELIDATEHTARLHINVCLSIPVDSISFRLTLRDSEEIVQEFESRLSEFTVQLQNPKLWWTHDLGDPHLYDLTLAVMENGKTIDRWHSSYGVRTIEIMEKAEDGTGRFLFVLNGMPIFCRGANWVPVSCFPGACDESRYARLLQMAADANMNMLCLWGGGIYEQPCFYEACDRLGLLVWQYFMFACGEYPDFDQAFVDEAHHEVVKAVKRLQNYCCIALWVGNVEGQLISEKISLQREMYGTRLFHEYIPQWLHELGEKRPYIPTSPFGGSTANSPLTGDRHNWDVWFTDVPYTDYLNDMTTFASEYGIHACPARTTVEKYLQQKNPDFKGHAFNYFNKDQDLGRMHYLIKFHIGVPETLDEYIDYSQMVQAEGLRTGSEHFRRNFPHTGGALIWQLNDCCPVHSWSIIDVDLIPKASYYYTRRFFAPFVVSLEAIDENNTDVWLVNNTANPIEDQLTIGVKDYFGNVLWQELKTIRADANRSCRIERITAGGRFYPNVILPDRLRNYYVFAKLDGQPLSEKRLLGKDALFFPPATLSADWSPDGRRLHITSMDVFARFVKIDGELSGLSLSDNFFDLEAGQTYGVEIQVLSGKPLQDREIFIKAINTPKIPVPRS